MLYTMESQRRPVFEPSRLLAFGRLSGGPDSEICAFAFVGVELLLDGSLCFGLLDVGMKLRRKLHVAVFTDTEHRNVFDAPNDPKIPLWHKDSLRCRRKRSRCHSLH